MKKTIIACFLVLMTGSLAPAGPLTFDKSEYAARRARLMAQIPDGIAVIWGALARDQNTDFNYFCGVKVPRAALIIDAVRKESHLFYTTTEDYLKGQGMSVELARDPRVATGVEKYYPADMFSTILNQLAAQSRVIYTPFMAGQSSREVAIDNEWDGRLTRELQFIKLLKERFPRVEVKDCSPIIGDLRSIKSAAEIEVLRQVSRIGAQAMIEVMKAAHPGQYEYELSALFEYACKRAGCHKLNGDIIISSGENHPYIHYSQNDRLLIDGDFLVIDAGPVLADYAADITISFPINGKFTPRQQEIYEAGLAVQKEFLAILRPGMTAAKAHEIVWENLTRKGIDMSKDIFKIRTMQNGISHNVGLAVHDPAGSVPGGPLKVGQVFTCDIYAAVFPGENLGFRIEDMVVITETGCENLTPNIPRSISEIEELMMKNAAGKAVKNTSNH